MSSVTAADYGCIRTSETFGLGLEFGYTLILVQGLGPAQVVDALRAEPSGAGRGIDPIVQAALDGWDTVGVVAVPGDDGPWALVLTVTDELAMRPRLLEPLSLGRRMVMHSSNGGKPMHYFFWYEDGVLRTWFEWAADRSGSTPDDLVPLMREVGCDLEDELDLDVYDERAAVLALAERLTGVRITEDLLRDAEYQLVRVPDGPDEA
ncbi:DUF6461 domain-containing protein [Streptodolium elevatio]